MSKRMAETFCTDVLGVPVCAGQICASEAATAAATEPVVQELREYVQSQPANVDETGWWQRRQRGWLWTVVTQAVTVFTIAWSRAGSVARGLVDPSAGQVLTTDRYKGYVWLPLRRGQPDRRGVAVLRPRPFHLVVPGARQHAEALDVSAVRGNREVDGP